MKPRDFKHLFVGDVVVIKWFDAHSDAGWRDFISIGGYQYICETVGFVMECAEHYLVLAQSLGYENYNENRYQINRAADLMNIPYVNILDLKIIRKING